MTTYDVAVVGLGIVGASALRYFADQGIRAIGLEAFGPAHGYGSSHGESRIFRRAYWEGATYLPLLDRAHALWSELRERTREPIIMETGGVFMGLEETGMVARSRQTALAFDVPHEMLDAGQLRARFPAFRVEKGMIGIYEPGAYMILAERARFAMLDLAVQGGAEARFGVRVTEMAPSGQAITITVQTGETFSCGAVVVATGAWMANQLVEDVRPFIQPTQVPIYWFRAASGHEAEHAAGRLPVFLHESPSGRMIYGCPSWGEHGVKVGFHNHQQVVRDPSILDRTVSGALWGEMAGYLREVLPALDPIPIKSHICYYTMSKDGNFIIDRSRLHSNVAYASACSGHGFKFAPAVGEAVARLALGQELGHEPRVDLTPYRLLRFDE